MMKRCVPNSTGMIAVALDHVTLTNIIQRLSIACYNSPSDHIVSGPVDDLKELKEYLDGRVHCRNISVPFGYHSSSMDPILDEFSSIASNIVLSPPTIPVVSTVLGDTV
jgi:acyl transferase domain-containing protein